MHTSDTKIFELIKLLKSLGKIEFDYEFCENIGIKKTNLAPIKKGLAHFTAKHIEMICTVYHVNANWIFGIENQVFTKIKSNQKSVQNTSIH